MEFLLTALASFLGAVPAGLFIDWCIRKQIRKQNKKRLFENLRGDLEYNLSINQEVKRVFKEYMINVAHFVYTTDGIRDFVYQKAFNTHSDLYDKLLKLLVLLESSNKLLQAALFRSDSGRYVIVENSIKSNTSEIEKILNELLK